MAIEITLIGILVSVIAGVISILSPLLKFHSRVDVLNNDIRHLQARVKRLERNVFSGNQELDVD